MCEEIDLNQWSLNISVHQMHLQGLLRDRLLSQPQSFRCSRSAVEVGLQ